MRRSPFLLLLLMACGTTPNHPGLLGDCSKQPCTVPNTGGGSGGGGSGGEGGTGGDAAGGGDAASGTDADMDSGTINEAGTGDSP